MGKLNLEKVKKDVIENGGATYDATTGDAVLLSRGFVVSLDYVGIVCRSLDALSGAMLSLIQRRAKKYGGFVGLWQDEKTGLVYLDVSQVYDDEKRAELFARANNQLAYYDAAKNVSIYLD